MPAFFLNERVLNAENCLPKVFIAAEVTHYNFLTQ